MPKAKTIDEVRQKVFELSDGKTELLSSEYINDRTPLRLRCGKCGKEFERDYSHIRRGRIWCEECARKESQDKQRFSIDYVEQIIESHGCKLMSDNYQNNTTKLQIECRCGRVFEKSLQKFMSGQDRCPFCGKQALIKSKTKYTSEDAKRIFATSGYEMVGDYINAYTPVKCFCKRGHECNLILSQFLVHRSGCGECAIIDHRGENHWNYKGGVSLLEDAIRHSLDDWKTSIRKCYQVCPITGESGLNAEVHHLLSLSIIFKDAIDYLNIDIETKKQKIKNCSDSDEYYSLINEIVNRHNLYSGILISKDIHVKFHKEYGYGNNTPQQFDEFLQKHYSVKLSDIQDRFIQKGG